MNLSLSKLLIKNRIEEHGARKRGVEDGTYQIRSGEDSRRQPGRIEGDAESFPWLAGGTGRRDRSMAVAGLGAAGRPTAMRLLRCRCGVVAMGVVGAAAAVCGRQAGRSRSRRRRIPLSLSPDPGSWCYMAPGGVHLAGNPRPEVS